MFFDTHCHLDANAFDTDRDLVIDRAKDAKVDKVLLIGLNAVSSQESLSLAERHRFRFTAGIHPHEADNYSEKDVQTISELAQHPLCSAVGEIGLDFYREYAAHENQYRLFKTMVDLAQKLHKPIVVHQRSSFSEVINVLDERGFKEGGVFHCFSGDLYEAEEVLNRGFYISFAGNISFKNNTLIEIAAQLPLNRILIETDAPYITPVPHRGKRNEPAFVVHTAAALALAKKMTVDEIAAVTYNNGCELFGW